MSFESLKIEIDALEPSERRKLLAYMVGLNRKISEDERREFDRMIEDQDPANWMTLDQLDDHLSKAD